MKKLIAYGFSLLLVVTVMTPASAHSMKSLEKQLYDTEKYFQPFNKEAPDFTLQDADRKTISLADLRGKVVIVHFIYTNCPDVCPLHAERIAEIQEMINLTPMRDLVQFITITTDPKNDTPEVMRSYGKAHGLDTVNWMFLTSGSDNLATTRQLVERFGHKFTKSDDGYQVHSVVTHVIDKQGRWRANFHGLKFQPVNFVQFVNALTNDFHEANEQQDQGIWEKLRSMF